MGCLVSPACNSIIELLEIFQMVRLAVVFE